MKPVKASTTVLLAIVALALGGCAAEVTPNDPNGSTTLTGDHSGDQGGSDGTGGGGGGGGYGTAGNYNIQSKRVGQQNPNHEQGTPNEGPQPNPWIGGSGGQSNQAPTSHHGNFAAKSDVPTTD